MPPTALQKHKSNIESIMDQRLGEFEEYKEEGSYRASASQSSPSCFLFLRFSVFHNTKMPKQSCKTWGMYILNVNIE